MEFKAKSKGLCIFIKPLIPIAIGNGFSFGKEKIKLNNKLLLCAQTETKSFLASALCLAQTLGAIMTRPEICIHDKKEYYRKHWSSTLIDFDIQLE